MFGLKSTDGYTEVITGIQIKTLCYGENTLMTEFLLKKGSILPEHNHVQEQTGYLVSGKIILYINNISQIITAGDSWNIAANIKHRAEIIENSVAIEIFSPCRGEYIKYVNGKDVIQ